MKNCKCNIYMYTLNGKFFFFNEINKIFGIFHQYGASLNVKPLCQKSISLRKSKLDLTVQCKSFV